ncbi:MAG: hypothetical protein B7X54_05135 [Idiomarina sp. 34-48-12]|nr:MAG: hypothetical protein B7X54_05135 [Idiomarina sp. 34-48-12]
MTENIFNKSQQEALAALGLPLWQKRANLATEKPATDNSDEDVSHCYRLGPWLLLFTAHLPVKHPQWLADFAHALGHASSSVIAEVPSTSKEHWDKAFIVKFSADIQDTIPATMKAEIWDQIQHHRA